VLLAAVLLGAAACQSRVAIDARVERDGSGVLNVGVGVDDAALQRIGDLDRQVRVGDLAAAGWQVSRAHKEPDGLTWLRASKPFRSTEELNGVLTEVTGPPGVLHDVRLVDEDVGTATVHHLAGTLDLSPGLALFADPALTARLGTDPVAGQAAAIEQAGGRPLKDLVAFDVTARLGDEGVQTLHPTLGAAPTALDVAVREDKPVASVGGGVPLGAFVLGGGVVAAMLVAARRRFAGSPGEERLAAASAPAGDPEADGTVVVAPPQDEAAADEAAAGERVDAAVDGLAIDGLAVDGLAVDDAVDVVALDDDGAGGTVPVPAGAAGEPLGEPADAARGAGAALDDGDGVDDPGDRAAAAVDGDAYEGDAVEDPTGADVPEEPAGGEDVSTEGAVAGARARTATDPDEDRPAEEAPAGAAT
jgi:hypothetical protein